MLRLTKWLFYCTLKPYNEVLIPNPGSKSTYIKLCKEYMELYGQEYEKSFADITNKPLAEILNYNVD